MPCLAVDMEAALECDEMNDVELIGSDDSRVRAAKFVLAARSPIFRRMFYGEFRERSSDHVTMDQYHGVVLNVLVRYCYTDVLDLDLLYATEDEESTDAEVVLLWQLRDAANYLELFSLKKTLTNELGVTVLRDDMGSMCALLQAMMVSGGQEEPLWQACLDAVGVFSEGCLLPTTQNSGITACSIELLRTLLGIPMVDVAVAVKALKLWRQEHTAELDKKEWEELRKLASEIKLETMQMDKLANLKPCDLFPVERCHVALCMLANETKNSKTPASGLHFQQQVNTAVVRGCGTTCCNGEYVEKMTFDCEVRKFLMHGDFEGMSSVFQLIFEEKRWTLQVVLPGTKTIRMYETAKMEREDAKTAPPVACWNRVDGEDTTPFISILPRTNMCNTKGPSSTKATGKPRRVRSRRDRRGTICFQ